MLPAPAEPCSCDGEVGAFVAPYGGEECLDGGPGGGEFGVVDEGDHGVHGAGDVVSTSCEIAL